MAVSKLLAASGANDFNLNITGLTTVAAFDKEYSSGSYSIVSSGNDATLDIYAYSANGTLVGYTATKAFTATGGFNKMVILGGTIGDVLGFTYKKTITTTDATAEVTAGPVATSISPTAAPNANNTFTLTGRNFSTNMAVTFTSANTSYSPTAAKSITRNSATSLTITRPDNLPISGSPYTITVENVGVVNPTGSNSHILPNALTAGNAPVWVTAATLPSFTRNVSYSTTVSATDVDSGSTITYSLVSGTFPTGISIASNGVISGTATTASPVTVTLRATDAGGNFVDRAFTMANAGPTWVSPNAGNLATVNYGDSYSVTLVATDDSGVAPTYSIVSGSASGMTLNSTTGVLSGTPASSSFTVAATDANGIQTTRAFSITVNEIIGFLVIAGGGGGGGSQPASNNRAGGGGGAGGYRTSVGTSGGNSAAEAGIALTPGTAYSCTIGAGGNQGGASSGAGSPGGSSNFHNITSTGGGAGGASFTNNGIGNGGSGGGGGADGFGGGAGISGQGHNGAQSQGSNTSGGGGGAGSPGSPDTNRGAGLTSSINGVLYAQGGQGSNGSFIDSNQRGDGGGGSWNGEAFGAGGKPGIVVLRYPVGRNITLNGLSGSTVTSGIYKITEITSGSGNVVFS